MIYFNHSLILTGGPETSTKARGAEGGTRVQLPRKTKTCHIVNNLPDGWIGASRPVATPALTAVGGCSPGGSRCVLVLVFVAVGDGLRDGGFAVPVVGEARRDPRGVLCLDEAGERL